MTSITPGDHIIVSRVGYTHHGIYIGDGCVIHYSGLANGLNKGAIKETSLDDFAQVRKVSIRKYQNPVHIGEE